LIKSEVDMDKAFHQLNRRNFLKRASVFAIALPTGIFIGCTRPAQTQPAQSAVESRAETRGRVGGYCEGCEAIYEGMPAQLNWETRIAPANEPGEPMEASGVIYQPDGRTPAPGVILYAYHTDAHGIYPPAPNASGMARRHGRLRGWIKTNARGEYKFVTIKPASYPDSTIPSHVHLIVKEADKNEYYIDDFEFDDDRFLTQQERARRRKAGGSGVVRLTKNAGGVWIAKRDIILGLNVPNYR
jgi:protocatechuate 3,4-dioxygenase beta subunit